MSRVKKLVQQRADLVAEGKRLREAAAAENRLLSAQERERYVAIEAELQAVDGDLAIEQRQLDRERTAPTVPHDNADTDDERAARDGNPAAGFQTLGEQLIAVRNAGMGMGIDPRLQAGPTGLNEGVGSDGGFLVRQQQSSEVLRRTYEVGQLLSRVSRQPIGSGFNGIKLYGVDETSRANGSRYGGLQVYWPGEGNAPTPSKPKFREMDLKLKKVVALVYATDELLADATALDGFIRVALPEELSFAVEDTLINGTGSGQPLGILTSGATVTVLKEASQPAATILAENILKMWSRMWARSRRNSVWLINQDIEPQLFQLNVKVKNVAGTENVGGFPVAEVKYIPPGTNGNEFGLLMGRPVIPVEYCATLGTKGDIALVDLSQYAFIDKSGIEQAVSMHVRFEAGEQVYRFTYRVDGQPIWHVPLTPKNGVNTLSPFVVLETRS